MAKVQKEKKNKLGVFLLFISILLLAAGGVLTYLTSPKYVASTVLKETGTSLTKWLSNDESTGLEDNYQMSGTLKINLQSDYYQGLSTTNPDYATTAKLLTNLTNTQNNFQIVHDKDNKRLFVNYDSKLNNQNLFNTKFLVENATAYYYIDGVTSTYINNGNNNYFESLNSTTTTKENLKYLIEKTMEYIGNNIKDDYLTTTYQDNYKIITLTLTEKDSVTLGNAVLKDLKKDDKAHQILLGYDPEFDKVKLTEEDVKGQGTIKLHIYSNKLTLKNEKYILEDENNNSITYTDTNNKKTIEIKSEESTTVLTITTDKDKTVIDITDEEGNNLGNVSISKTSTNYDIVAKIQSDSTTIDFGYNSQKTNLKKGKSYDKQSSITLNVTSQNTNIINGTITLDAKVTNDTKITEDTSTSVLASSIDGTRQELLNQKITTVLTQLMS